MIASLPLFHRISGRKVVVVGEGAMGEAKARLVERAGGVVCAETEAHQASLAFVAVEDARKAEAIARRLKSLGLLVNVADRPELCDFTTPSILDRDPVLVAIGTSGASAGLAKQLRLRLEAMLPQSLGRLADGLGRARDAIRAQYPDASDRRIALDEALSENGPLDPLDARSAGHIDGWLAPSAVITEDRTVEIHLTSDDPDDLTLRQARLLGMADTILHDPQIAAAVLERARADAVRRAYRVEAETPPGLTIILRRAG